MAKRLCHSDDSRVKGRWRGSGATDFLRPCRACRRYGHPPRSARRCACTSTTGPGAFADLARAIGDAGGSLGAIDLVRVEQGKKVRDVTVDAASADHIEQIVAAVHGAARRRGRARLRPDVPAAPRRQDRDGVEVAAEDARRPLDGLHARRRAGLPRDRRGPQQGLEPHDQAEHRRGRERRHGRARARRHRARGGDAGDGGQGDAVQGVRRRRRVADLPRDDGRGRDRRRRRPRSRPASAASTSRTSRRRAASRSRAGSRRRSTSRSSTTTSTARRSSCSAAFLNALQARRQAARGRPRRDRRASARPASRRPTCCSALGVRDIIGCDRQRRAPPRPRRPRAVEDRLRRADEPRGLRRHRPTRRSPAPTSSSASRARARSRRDGDRRRWPTTRSCSRCRTRRRRSMPEEIEGLAAVVATGRSDYPNQINNVLAFPGVFRGALDVRASAINEEMKLAAARGDRRGRQAGRARAPSTSSRASSTATSPRPSPPRSSAAAEATGVARAPPGSRRARPTEAGLAARPRSVLVWREKRSSGASRTPSASRT